MCVCARCGELEDGGWCRCDRWVVCDRCRQEETARDELEAAELAELELDATDDELDADLPPDLDDDDPADPYEEGWRP